MLLLAWVGLMMCWFAWLYPFLFRAPHHQTRPSVTLIAPTRVGLLLECIAIFIAFACRVPVDSAISIARLAGCLILGIVAALLSWTAVRHLGRQFRVHAGLYEDHELVRTGPYALVRHPIYTSLLAILGATLCLLTPWEWAVISLAIFVTGTEIRVHAEDNLLASRFGEQFAEYKSRVSAYVPFIR